MSNWSLSPEELEFLGSHVKATDSVWEWGSGDSTRYLSGRCGQLTAVEHEPLMAVRAISLLLTRTSVLYIPADRPLPHVGHDGDGDTHRAYVDTYTGNGVDVVLIDGRARVACARRVAEAAHFGPNPGMRVFLHDCERAEYSRIWQDGDEGPGYFKCVEIVGKLMRMEPRL